ncbi:MAG: hypothetical protein AAGG01_20235, partial [Planctomycetota bacterium]
ALWSGSAWRAAPGAATLRRCESLLPFRGKLYASGFDAFEIQGSVVDLARFDGQSWEAVGSTSHRAPTSLAPSADGRALLLSGYFSSFDGMATEGAFQLACDGAPGSVYCSASAHSSGVPANLFAVGTNVVAQNDLVLRSSTLPPSVPGYFLTSRTTALAQPIGSEGTLCLGGTIGRFLGPGQVLHSGAAGQVQLTVDLHALPQPTGAVSGIAGEAWHFQLWFRDWAPTGATSNFSDGLQVVLE